jgi:hypothetical protein
MLLAVTDGFGHIRVILITDHKPDGRDFRKQHRVIKQSRGVYASVGIAVSYFFDKIKLPLKNFPNSNEYSV